MAMSIWIGILISETIIQIECAPKHRLLFDPVSYETEKKQKVNNVLVPVALSKMNNTKNEPILTPTTESQALKLSDIVKMFENSAEGPNRQQKLSKYLRYGDSDSFQQYYYNNEKCRVVNDRILCGYEKNKGVLVHDEIIELGNDCRLRRDRIECGYRVPPYKNPRLPSGWYRQANPDEILVLPEPSHQQDNKNGYGPSENPQEAKSEEIAAQPIIIKPNQDIEEFEIVSPNESSSKDIEEFEIVSPIESLQKLVPTQITDLLPKGAATDILSEMGVGVKVKTDPSKLVDKTKKIIPVPNVIQKLPSLTAEAEVKANKGGIGASLGINSEVKSNKGGIGASLGINPFGR